MNSPPVEYVSFDSRESRSRFVAERLKKYLDDTVLDVGCFEAPLRDLLPKGVYTGIDFAGRPDIRLNLEEAERLPFGDRSFKTVICIDVLEHLDNLHLIFAELVRVADRYVVVSLPNAWCEARRPIGRGKGSFGHYGLPMQKPPDRHKWFFSISEAANFLKGKAAENGLFIEEVFVTEKPRSGLIRLVRRMRYPGDKYRNRYCQAIWAVMRKSTSGAEG